MLDFARLEKLWLAILPYLFNLPAMQQHSKLITKRMVIWATPFISKQSTKIVALFELLLFVFTTFWFMVERMIHFFVNTIQLKASWP
jgi:hypothetical protein